MKKSIVYLLCILFYSCIKQPKIAISNTLEIGLGDKYNEYVNILNNAYDGDSLALQDFLKINYISDGAGYDHGYVLLQLIKIIGDEEFAKTLEKMDNKTVESVCRYIEVGVDANDNNRDDLKVNYPKVVAVLKFK